MTFEAYWTEKRDECIRSESFATSEELELAIKNRMAACWNTAIHQICEEIERNYVIEPGTEIPASELMSIINGLRAGMNPMTFEQWWATQSCRDSMLEAVARQAWNAARQYTIEKASIEMYAMRKGFVDYYGTPPLYLQEFSLARIIAVRAEIS